MELYRKGALHRRSIKKQGCFTESSFKGEKKHYRKKRHRKALIRKEGQQKVCFTEDSFREKGVLQKSALQNERNLFREGFIQKAPLLQFGSGEIYNTFCTLTPKLQNYNWRRVFPPNGLKWRILRRKEKCYNGQQTLHEFYIWSHFAGCESMFPIAMCWVAAGRWGCMPILACLKERKRGEKKKISLFL